MTCPARKSPQTDPEPAPAVFQRVGWHLRRVDGEIALAARERIEARGDAPGFEFIANSAHAHFLGLAPLRRLQRYVDARRQQPQERRDDQPRPLGSIKLKEMHELAHRGRAHHVDGDTANDKDTGGDLGHQFHRRVLAAEDDCHRSHAQQQPVEGQFVIVIQSRDVETEVLPEEIEGHRRARDQAAGLSDSGLDHRGDQYVPDGDFLPRRGIGVQHAAPGGVGEAKRHFEPVVLEDIGDGYAPQQRIAEAPAGHRRGHQVARADAGHHQDHARTELANQARRRHGWELQGLERAFSRVGSGRFVAH